jgi:hypothetical protein
VETPALSSKAVHLTEASLRGAMLKDARKYLPSYVFQRHEDRFTGGVPDLSVVGDGLTSWWEFKYAAPRLISNELQDLQLKRLFHANGGRALYIVYANFQGEKSTHILTPAQYASPDWYADSLFIFGGFDHEKVIYTIQSVHRGLKI